MNEPNVIINVKLNYVPFGQIKGSIQTQGDLVQKQIEQHPIYIEPRTTNIEKIEFIFGGREYIVPKTTVGIL